MKVQNNIKLSICTEDEGIDLLRLAGFNIKKSSNYFYIYDDDDLISGNCNISLLKNPEFLMRIFIKRESYNKGVERGKKEMQESFKSLLDI